jgi:hypothetical protein
MKKFLGLFLFVSSLALALQFYGHQSLVNLGTTALFTAPASRSYFIKGTLSLPQPSLNGGSGASQVVARIIKNGVSTLYTGISGASGFSMPQVSLVTNDAITVSLTSPASIDQGLNVIKGDVFFGNAF